MYKIFSIIIAFVLCIETTDSHPFWVVTDEPDLERAARSVVDENGVWLYHENVGPTEHGYWVEAKDLREGDVFLGANGELSTLVVAERVVFPDGIRVYNFTVDGNHDYFVIAAVNDYGQTCVLVHNACWDDLIKNSTLKKMGNKNRAAIHERPGGLAEATADFHSLNPRDVVLRPNNGLSGILPDGTKINVHPSSTSNSLPTLEIQTVIPKYIKMPLYQNLWVNIGSGSLPRA